MESKQAAALASVLSANSGERGAPAGALSLPSELGPFPSASRRRRTFADIAKLLLACIVALQLCYLLGTAILISAYRYMDPPVTVLMAYRKWSFGWRIQPPRPVPFRKVPRYIRSMLISVEDGKFYEHHGIDFEAFQRAQEIDKRIGKPLYGGSTLTMQVARTLFLVPVKSYLRKYLEILTALELEALLPKDRILELYFGYAEWGKGIFGMESAARKWYGRGISALSRDESARLVALLSSPIKYGPETLQRNGILRERYEYLSGRFDPQAQAVPSADVPPPPTPEPGAETEPSAESPQPDAPQAASP
jgi:monofunctional biosynthetic peptidoglycan transglycosylase